MITSILLGIGLLAIMPYLLKLFHIIIFLGYALYVFISCKDVRQNIIQTINHHVEQNSKICQQNDTNNAVKSEYDYSIYEFDEEAFEFVKSKAKQYGYAISLQFELATFYIKSHARDKNIENILARKFIFDWLDESRKSTLDAVREFISTCGIAELDYLGSRDKNIDDLDAYLNDVQQGIKEVSYIDEELNAVFNIEIIKYLQQKYKIGYYLE
jgi:hypothetical protein